MASSITIAERVFPVGPPITRTVDSFPVDVKRIRISMTRVNWPAGDVAKITVIWSDGNGAFAVFPGGALLGKDGQPELVSIFQIGVPQEGIAGGGKRRRNVVHGDFTLEVLKEFTSAITLEALA